MTKKFIGLLLLCTGILSSQEIKTHTKTDGITYYENKFDDNELLTSDQKKDLGAIEDAFKTINFKKLEKYLHPKIHRDSVRQYFLKSKSILKNNDWVTLDHYDIKNEPSQFKEEVIFNILKLEYQGFKLDVSYTYYTKDSGLRINSLELNFSNIHEHYYENKKNKSYFKKSSLPHVLNAYDAAITDFFDCKTLKCATDSEKQIQKHFNALKAYNYSFITEERYNSGLSYGYYNIARELLFLKDYEDALLASEKCEMLNPTKHRYQVDLAILYLLNNKLDKAKRKYDLLKYKKFWSLKVKVYGDVLKKRLDYYEDLGIVNSNFKKMREYMN